MDPYGPASGSPMLTELYLATFALITPSQTHSVQPITLSPYDSP